MPSTETKIWMALKSRIETLPGGLFVAFPASAFTPDETAYIAVGRVTIAPQRVFVSAGKHERTGTITLTHVAPIGQDVAVYEEAGGEIAAHFPQDMCLRYQNIRVRIVSEPHVVDGFREGAWWRTPVNIRWRCAA